MSYHLLCQKILIVFFQYTLNRTSTFYQVVSGLPHHLSSHTPLADTVPHLQKSFQDVSQHPVEPLKDVHIISGVFKYPALIGIVPLKIIV